MDTGVALLGLIALGSLAQLAFIAGLGLSGWRLFKRFQGIQRGVSRELRPVIDNVNEVARNMATVSEVAALQVQRLQEAVATGRDRVDEARREVARSLRRPFRSVGAVSALWRSARRGLSVYRTLGSLEAPVKGRGRRYRDDEHLFI
jgi:hypothetical protein